MFCGQNRPCPQSLEEESADHEHDEPAMGKVEGSPVFFYCISRQGETLQYFNQMDTVNRIYSFEE